MVPHEEQPSLLLAQVFRTKELRGSNGALGPKEHLRKGRSGVFWMPRFSFYIVFVCFASVFGVGLFCFCVLLCFFFFGCFDALAQG